MLKKDELQDNGSGCPCWNNTKLTWVVQPQALRSNKGGPYGVHTYDE